MGNWNKRKIVKALIDCFERGNKVLIAGNGGSATQASHFAGELLCKLYRWREPLPAIPLSDFLSPVTAIANDLGYQYVFSRPLSALGKEGDIFISLSTSGKSQNLLEAIKIAEGKKLIVIEWPRKGKDVADIQEKQVKLMHQVCEEVEDYYVVPSI